MDGYHRQAVHRWNGERFSMDADHLADESVVHLLVNGSHVTTLLASQTDVEALCIGHMATEYSIKPPHDQTRVVVEKNHDGLAVNLLAPIDNEPEWRPKVVTTSCGACDLEGLPELVSLARRVDEPSVRLSMDSLTHHFDTMRQQQTTFAHTGGVHAAGLLYDDETLVVMEDIGRHNAVDKVLGQHLMLNTLHHPVALLLSGRCGWDIVAKAARMNIGVIASIGAASQLAADVARKANISLVTFVKDGKATLIGPVEGRFEAKD